MQSQLSVGARRAFGRPALVFLVALIVLVLIAGAITIGSQLLPRPQLPPPFGVATNGLIAADVGGQIVVMEPDGSDARPLDLPFTELSQVSFSRDGTRFAAFAKNDPAARFDAQLIVANADGTGAYSLGPEVGIPEDRSRIAWSPDDRRLLFSSSGTLYLAELDARTVETFGAEDVARRDPTWSPDARIAYQCLRADGTLHLCVMDGDRTGEQVMVTSPGTLYAFQGSSWSPDGRSIAYQIDAVDGSGGWDIAALELATGKETILTNGTPEHTIYPSWNPDGRYVLFISGFVSADGKDVQSFGQGGCNWVEPSADGTVVTCITNDGLTLWPIAGGEPRLIPLDSTPTSVSWQRVASD
jgi:Tol biopolymer transport system component